MKTLNIAYWIVTALFSAFMIFSSAGGLTLQPDAVALMHDHMGYPLYFLRIISAAKIIGAIAILLPFVPARVKEWAYFGFFTDLSVATLSFAALGDPVSQWWPMLVFIGVLIAAYLLHHKRLAARS
jgi:hypothetical protein